MSMANTYVTVAYDGIRSKSRHTRTTEVRGNTCDEFPFEGFRVARSRLQALRPANVPASGASQIRHTPRAEPRRTAVSFSRRTQCPILEATG